VGGWVGFLIGVVGGLGFGLSLFFSLCLCGRRVLVFSGFFSACFAFVGLVFFFSFLCGVVGLGGFFFVVFYPWEGAAWCGFGGRWGVGLGFFGAVFCLVVFLSSFLCCGCFEGSFFFFLFCVGLGVVCLSFLFFVGWGFFFVFVFFSYFFFFFFFFFFLFFPRVRQQVP